MTKVKAKLLKLPVKTKSPRTRRQISAWRRNLLFDLRDVRCEVESLQTVLEGQQTEQTKQREMLSFLRRTLERALDDWTAEFHRLRKEAYGSAITQQQEKEILMRQFVQHELKGTPCP